MEILFHTALLAWLPAPLGTSAFGSGKENRMRNIDIAVDLQSSAPRDKAALANGLDKFTPAQFFKDAGTLIVVCLGLGFLMQILLG
jgi:hypothetical protein